MGIVGIIVSVGTGIIGSLLAIELAVRANKWASFLTKIAVHQGREIVLLWTL
jgi:hypothetical protein